MNEGEGMPEQEVKPRIDGQKGVATSKDNLLSGTSTTPPPSVNVEEGAIRENIAKFVMASPEIDRGAGRLYIGIISAQDRDCIAQALRSVETLTKERDDNAANREKWFSKALETHALQLVAEAGERAWKERAERAESELATLRSSPGAVGEDEIASKIRSLTYVYVAGREGCVLPTEDIEIIEVRGIDIAAREILALLASRSPSPSGDGWQPIEMAPKDRRIRLWARDAEHLGKWSDDRYNKKPRPYWAIEDFDKTWCREYSPTHWQPTSPPPSTPQASHSGDEEKSLDHERAEPK